MSHDVIPYREQMGALSPQDVRGQVQLIQEIMQSVMKKDEHYGVIPGTGTKPTLLKAGAEKLCLTFRLAPDYEIQEVSDGPHIRITSKCVLTHIPSGQRFGAGMGSCSTREAKYAYRKATRKCPNCGAEAIIKGKDFKGDGLPTGWVCFAKKGGCGQKFLDGDKSVEGQAQGRAPNEDVADQYNTVLKMANKRSLVAAVLNATAASDIFTQDIEDMSEPHVVEAAVDRSAELSSLCKDADVGLASLLDRAGVATAEEMTDADYNAAVAMLKRKALKMQKATAQPKAAA